MGQWFDMDEPDFIEVVEVPRFKMMGRRRGTWWVLLFGVAAVAGEVIRQIFTNGTSWVVFALIGSGLAGLVATAWLRERHRRLNLDEAVGASALRGSGSYASVWRFVGNDQPHPPLRVIGQDLRASPSGAIIGVRQKPWTIHFVSAWGPPKLGSLELPIETRIRLHAHGGRVRGIELLLDGRSLILSGSGSLIDQSSP